MKKTILLLSVSLLFLAPSFAQQVRRPNPGPAGSWRIIGTTQARFTADHDGILVQGPFNDFRRIKIKVTGAPLNMLRMIVTYGNGAPDNIETRFLIPEGGESRIIDLRGAGKRLIRRIDFWYDTRGVLRGRANVTVVGMK